MTSLVGHFGVRLECDTCGESATSPDLSLAQLRRAVGFLHAGGRDSCERCAAATGASSLAPNEPAASGGDA